MSALPFTHDDGGRSESGFRGDAGDCAARAFAILLGRTYRDVYDDLSGRVSEWGGPRSARNGVPMKVLHRFAEDNGLTWTPTMSIGSGTTVHLRQGELPNVPLVARVSKHVCAVIDGVIRDNHDPSRDGTRAVYGYWHRPVSEVDETIDLTAENDHHNHEETP